MGITDGRSKPSQVSQGAQYSQGVQREEWERQLPPSLCKSSFKSCKTGLIKEVRTMMIEGFFWNSIFPRQYWMLKVFILAFFSPDSVVCFIAHVGI